MATGSLGNLTHMNSAVASTILPKDASRLHVDNKINMYRRDVSTTAESRGEKVVLNVYVYISHM